MNKFNYELVENDTYIIGQQRLFIADKKMLNANYLANVAFPILVFDTEFINRSHNKIDPSPLYIKSTNFLRDVVYMLQYAVIRTPEELLNGKYVSKIKSMGVERKMETFNFFEAANDMKMKFVNLCLKEGIKTFVCSGGASDFRIIKQWFYEVLQDEELEKAAFINYNSPDDWTIKTLDVYDVLKNVFSFENQNQNGTTFIEPGRLKHGHHNQEMLELPSFNKLYLWTEGFWKFNFKDEGDWTIYDICVKMFEFYSYISTYRFKPVEFKEFVEIYRIALDHCWNDVYKILIFLQFCYQLHNN
jgi:hypothetical protein